MVHDVFGGQTVLPGEDKEVELTPMIETALADKRLVEVSGKDAPAEEAKPVAGAGPTSGAAAKGK